MENSTEDTHTDVGVQRVNDWYSVCSILSKPHLFIKKKI